MTSTQRKIGGKMFALYNGYPSPRAARIVAAHIRREVPEKGYLVRVMKNTQTLLDVSGGRDKPGKYIWYGVYIHDGTKKPMRG